MFDLFALKLFRRLAVELMEWKKLQFPIGSVVLVDGKNYGLAVTDDGCPPDKLPVRFENGNVWWKPVETVTRIEDVKSLPGWVRRMKLRWAGYEPLAAYYPRPAKVGPDKIPAH